jgi:cysteine-rich repeat protein
MSDCLTWWVCDAVGLSLDYTGTTLIAMQHTHNSGEPESFATFVWTQLHGPDFLGNALARRGVFVDAHPVADALISGDGKTVVVSDGSRENLGGSLFPESSGCFLAKLQDLDPSQLPTTPLVGALTPPRPACGNGALNPGEECDDGNVNDTDSCTARCARPRLGASRWGTCAVDEEGDVACWGSLARPLVGAERARSWAPVALPGVSNVVQLASDEEHSCAVLENGTIECWGDGEHGQLGNGGVLDSATPVQVVGISDAIQVSVRSWQSCAVVQDGSVYCWGANASDPLALDDSGDSAVPVVVPGLEGVVQVAHLKTECYAAHSQDPICGCASTGCSERPRFPTCALLDDSSVWCWGAVPREGSPEFSSEPVFLVDGVRQLSMGEDHVCALLDGGKASCWGNFSGTFVYFDRTFYSGAEWYNYWDGDWDAFSLTFPEDTIALVGGLSIHCALTSAGLVHCQGRDDAGSRGRGTHDARNRNGLGPVLGITNAVNLAVGTLHACAALADGGVKCWGAASHGQLGFGRQLSYFPGSLAQPVSVVGLP